MTISATLITDAFAESLDNGKTATIAGNSINPSSLCAGRRLRIKRISRGISQQELSEQLGTNRDDLNAYEAGTKRVGANLLLRIAKLLDVRPNYFFRSYTEEEVENCLERADSTTA